MNSKYCWAGRVAMVAIVLVMLCANMAAAKASVKNLDVSEIKIFDIKLKDATRKEFRKACFFAGMGIPKFSRSVGGMDIDTYDVKGQLDKASEFTTMFASDTGEFITAWYRFKPGTYIIDVIDMVAVKYGKPLKVEGPEVLPVSAWWTPDKSEWALGVNRSKDDESVTLNYMHISAHERLFERMSKTREAEIVEKGKAQTNAF